MEAVEGHLKKLREERLAREKARIEKLREMNLKKYKSETNINFSQNKPGTNAAPKPLPSRLKVAPKPNVTASRPSTAPWLCVNAPQKTNLTKPMTRLPRHDSVPTKNIPRQTKSIPSLTKNLPASSKTLASVTNNTTTLTSDVLTLNKNVPTINKTIPTISNAVPTLKTIPTLNKNIQSMNKTVPAALVKKDTKDDKYAGKNNDDSKRVHIAMVLEKSKTVFNNDIPKAHVKPMARKSMAPPPKIESISKGRKSMLPSLARPRTTSTESVFDRLYKNKGTVKHLEVNKILAEKTLPQKANMLKRDQKIQPVRRSISAVHLKLIPKNELANCFHKWASIDDLNHLKENEDDSVKLDKIISAVKSERKRVKFQKPISINFNTPKPEELQQRLQSWLQKRGKSINSYHHLQCFGLHHLSRSLKPQFDDENKENVALDHDSDNESYSDAMNVEEESGRWRRASYTSEDLDETRETPVVDNVHTQNELLVGALNDLTELLREGFDWQQSARWLRAVRERLPRAADCAAYWECRAALEERQGNLPASVHCWEEAIAKGTDRSVVEANLDQLLDKFMQLKISPNSAKKKQDVVNAKMVDVKNVFKSTIIRFAVQQAKLRKSTHSDPAVQYIVTPVRRSNRLSTVSLKTPRLLVKTPTGKRTPLVQICSSLRHIDEGLASKPVFVPNETLPCTP